MDYLQTTGDRLHDLELDRILTRLSRLEAQGAPSATGSSQTASASILSAPTVLVRTLTPVGGTPMQDDVTLAVAGPASFSQAAQVLTLTVNVHPATSVTPIGPIGIVGTATTFAREDHAHAGVHQITGSAAAQGDLVFTGPGVSQSGTTFTFAGSGDGVPTNLLVISPGSGAINWATPIALTEFNGLMLYRAQHDLTLATQARLALFLPQPNIFPTSAPTLAAQYSANGGTSWSYLDGTSGPNLAYGAGAIVSGWVSLAAGARTDVLLRIVASGGDGVTSLPFGTILLQAQ